MKTIQNHYHSRRAHNISMCQKIFRLLSAWRMFSFREGIINKESSHRKICTVYRYQKVVLSLKVPHIENTKNSLGFTK